ncbi:35999_t:CDS:1, partial [Racocetra persica]
MSVLKTPELRHNTHVIYPTDVMHISPLTLTLMLILVIVVSETL